MFNTSNNSQSGQSFTLDVQKDAATGDTIVSCPNVPDVAPVRDSDQRYAVQQMRKALDEHTHRGHQSRTPLMLPGDGGDL